MTRPSLDVDEAVRQLDVDITLGLGRFAPVRTKTWRLGLVVIATRGCQQRPTKPRESDVDWKGATPELDRQPTN